MLFNFTEDKGKIDTQRKILIPPAQPAVNIIQSAQTLQRLGKSNIGYTSSNHFTIIDIIPDIRLFRKTEGEVKVSPDTHAHIQIGVLHDTVIGNFLVGANPCIFPVYCQLEIKTVAVQCRIGCRIEVVDVVIVPHGGSHPAHRSVRSRILRH